MTHDNTFNLHEWRRAVMAGAGAGFTTSLVTCPMDVVKTRLQSQSIPRHANPHAIIMQSILMSANGNGNNNNNNAKPYKGTVPSLRRIFREEGIKGLYRGLTPTLVGYLPAHALYFSVYSVSKSWLGSLDVHPSLHTGTHLNHIVAAMMGGAMSSTATNPLWVIRTRLMTQFPGRTAFYYTGTIDAARQIWKHEGVSGLYKGLGPSILGVLHVAVQFPLYEHLKTILPTPDSKAELMRNVLLASTISKVTAATITYPHEVLRTRLQRESRPVHSAKYKGLIQGARLIWHEEGIFGFYRGLTTTIMRVVPASAVTLLTFEFLLQVL